MLDPERECRHAVDSARVEHFVDQYGRPLCRSDVNLTRYRHGRRVCMRCVRVRVAQADIFAA
jgi:hypothetical protein